MSTDDPRDVCCDICDGHFTPEDMHTLGGDRVEGGYLLTAYPAECLDCHEAHMAKGGAR